MIVWTNKSENKNKNRWRFFCQFEPNIDNIIFLPIWCQMATRVTGHRTRTYRGQLDCVRWAPDHIVIIGMLFAVSQNKQPCCAPLYKQMRESPRSLWWKPSKAKSQFIPCYTHPVLWFLIVVHESSNQGTLTFKEGGSISTADLLVLTG